jgi:surfactin synthase thioesterase subunit
MNATNAGPERPRATAISPQFVQPSQSIDVRGNAWLEYVRANPAAMSRLFCFPYAGGSASIFRDWHGGPLAACEVCPVQLPGRERRFNERPFDRMKRLAKAIVENLPQDKPFAFFGHSLGALLAFEVARELRRQSRPTPFHLFVSGAPAPQLCPHKAPRFNLDRDAFIAEIRKLGGTPDEALRSEELLELVLPVLRADFAVIDTYFYLEEPPLPCPITALAGSRDEEVDQFEVMDWRSQTADRFDAQVFPGDHFFITEFGSKVREIVGSAVAPQM